MPRCDIPKARIWCTQFLNNPTIPASWIQRLTHYLLSLRTLSPTSAHYCKIPLSPRQHRLALVLTASPSSCCIPCPVLFLTLPSILLSWSYVALLSIFPHLRAARWCTLCAPLRLRGTRSLVSGTVPASDEMLQYVRFQLPAFYSVLVSASNLLISLHSICKAGSHILRGKTIHLRAQAQEQSSTSTGTDHKAQHVIGVSSIANDLNNELLLTTVTLSDPDSQISTLEWWILFHLNCCLRRRHLVH